MKLKRISEQESGQEQESNKQDQKQKSNKNEIILVKKLY